MILADCLRFIIYIIIFHIFVFNVCVYKLHLNIKRMHNIYNYGYLEMRACGISNKSLGLPPSPPPSIDTVYRSTIYIYCWYLAYILRCEDTHTFSVIDFKSKGLLRFSAFQSLTFPLRVLSHNSILSVFLSVESDFFSPIHSLYSPFIRSPSC